MTNFEKDKQMFDKIGVQVFEDLPSEHFDFLLKNISKQIPKNLSLAGHIKEEYDYMIWPENFEKWLIEKIFNNDVLMGYMKSVDVISEPLPFYLQSLWVNLQKKYEFNPIHDHGGIYSFIIPLQIPYKLEDEDVYFPKTSYKQSCTSRLCFVTTDPLGAITPNLVNMDKSYIGKVIVFPAKLQHMVYPFYTSDEHRITVSGNIAYKVK